LNEGVLVENGHVRHAAGVREGVARRVTRVVAGIAVVLSLIASASDTRVASVTNARAAGAGSQPLQQFGYAHGTVSDLGLTDMRHYLDAIAKVTGPGGIVRAPLHWDPFQSSGPSWTKYDAFLNEVRARDLVWLPEVHISHDGHYVMPTQAPGGWADWQADIRAAVARYGPGGAYADGHPGFGGITRWEIWNEPNTPTGNATPNHDGSVDMNPDTAAEILRTGSQAVRGQAAADGWTPEIAGPAIGAIDIAYITRLKAADPAFFSYLDTLTVHVYMSKDPNTCPIGEVRCIRTLGSLRSWMNANGGPGDLGDRGDRLDARACRPRHRVLHAVQPAGFRRAISVGERLLVLV
jgi:hypothetical protein